MPFGRYKGRPIADMPTREIASLLGWKPLGETKWLWLKRLLEAELSRRREGIEERLAELDAPLPEAEPREVCGVYLDRFEAGRFEQAVAAGYLEVTPDLPCASPLPEVWKRWCGEQGLPYRIVDVPLLTEDAKA
jgi:hypothetical protein